MEYDHDVAVAFALAGTVAIPSPVPAVGKVSIGLVPVPAGFAGDRGYYLNVVQAVDETTIVSRHVRLENLRAVRAPGKDDSPTNPATWPVKTRDEIDAGLREVLARLGKDVTEVPLYDRAILYVPRSAPVLVSREMGMTAEESVDDYCVPPFTCVHPCCPCVHPCCCGHATLPFYRNATRLIGTGANTDCVHPCGH